MRIDEILAGATEPVFSFEFFPPQTPEGEATLRSSLEALQVLEPDFASVTYGAGGSTRERTVEITKWIKQEMGVEAMAHLSCVGASREQMEKILDGIEAAGIDNVLALRGDPPRGETEWRPPGRPLKVGGGVARALTGPGRRVPAAITTVSSWARVCNPTARCGASPRTAIVRSC